MVAATKKENILLWSLNNPLHTFKKRVKVMLCNRISTLSLIFSFYSAYSIVKENNLLKYASEN